MGRFVWFYTLSEFLWLLRVRTVRGVFLFCFFYFESLVFLYMLALVNCYRKNFVEVVIEILRFFCIVIIVVIARGVSCV